MQEHAVEVFETLEIVIRQAAKMVCGPLDDQIRTAEPELRARLRELIVDSPQVYNLWFVDGEAQSQWAPPV